jgi:hypothetical protein
MKNEQLNRLNALKADFMKCADSNESSTWELDVNKINAHITGFNPDDEPVIILDNTYNKTDWFLSINVKSEDEIGCYPLTDLADEQIYEIRRIVESWLAKKDISNFYI